MKKEIIKCKCIDISLEGYGIAKHNDLVIFVKDFLLGEEANVKIIKHAKNYDVGIIDELLTKSIDRKELDCPIAYKCGGCDYRHTNYENTLRIKKHNLENIFKDFNIKVNDVIPSENPLYYRNKTQIPFKDNKLGFYRKHSNDIVEFDECLIQKEIFNDITKDIKELIDKYNLNDKVRHLFIRQGNNTNEIMLALIVNTFDINNIEEIKDCLINKYKDINSFLLNLNKRNDNVILGEDIKLIYGNEYINDIYDDIKVRISLKSFYQVNHPQMIKMYSKIKDLANLNKDSKVLDLYSGIGTISLFLAKHVDKVVGVEIVEDAVKDAKKNAEINDIKNAEFYYDDASKNMHKYIKDKDVVIVDPPRKGLSKELIEELDKSNIDKIVYVSCNPLTLHRDLKLFKNYTFDEINPIDMFPYSKHVEAVILLSLAN